MYIYLYCFGRTHNPKLTYVSTSIKIKHKFSHFIDHKELPGRKIVKGNRGRDREKGCVRERERYEIRWRERKRATEREIERKILNRRRDRGNEIDRESKRERKEIEREKERGK